MTTLQPSSRCGLLCSERCTGRGSWDRDPYRRQLADYARTPCPLLWKMAEVAESVLPDRLPADRSAPAVPSARGAAQGWTATVPPSPQLAGADSVRIVVVS